MSTVTNTDAAVQDPVAWSAQVVPGRYRSDWQLFLDWCTATGRVALPADPGTVVGFLDAHPATRATHRRRLTAIRWIHRHARELAPHRTTQLRSRVLPPTGKTTIDSETVRPILEQMPTSGWTAGLVGRRDALLLVLAAHGVPYAAIERLRRRDVIVDENRCLVVTLPTTVVTLPTTVVRIPAVPEDPRACPVAVYLRWARLLAYHDRYPSTLALAEALRRAVPVTAKTVEIYKRLPTVPREERDPLLPGLDRWGQFAVPRGDRAERFGITAESAAAIVGAHLGGTARFRTLDTRVADPAVDDEARDDAITGMDRRGERSNCAPRIDGVARRRADIQRLADLEKSFAEIEKRAVELTAWLDSLIGESAVGP